MAGGNHRNIKWDTLTEHMCRRRNVYVPGTGHFPNSTGVLRRRYTIRFARAEPADCPVHGPIVNCGMSLECTGAIKIGVKGITPRSIYEPIFPHGLCDYPIRA